MQLPYYSAHHRRYALVRLVASLTGDFAVGMAFGSACAWFITTAALGAFLALLAWIATALLALLVSQHVIHPGVKFVLSDTKLDDLVDAAISLAEGVADFARGAGSPAWDHLRGSFGRFAAGFTAR